MSKATAFKVNQGNSYKVGVNEIVGLREAMHAALKPALDAVKSKAYWDESLESEDTEYRSRDGFIPYSHNCGGVEISLIIPKCEEYEWSDAVEFGECDDAECDHESECGAESDGHLDAKLRIWLKLEGVDEHGVLSFYLYAGGGNGDAPYFRTKHETTRFEYEFQTASLAMFKTKAAKAVAKMIKDLKLA